MFRIQRQCGRDCWTGERKWPGSSYLFSGLSRLSPRRASFPNSVSVLPWIRAPFIGFMFSISERCSKSWTCLVAGLMPGTPQACIGSDVSVALVIEDDALDPETVRLWMPTSRRSQVRHNEMLAHCNQDVLVAPFVLDVVQPVTLMVPRDGSLRMEPRSMVATCNWRMRRIGSCRLIHR